MKPTFDLSGPACLALTGLAIIAIVVLVVLRIEPPYHVVEPFLQRMSDPALYTHYDQLDRSVIAKSSLAMTLLSWIGLDLTAVWPWLITYVLTVMIGAWAVWRIARDILGLDTLAAVLFLSVLLYLDGRLFQNSHSSWTPLHNGSLTAPAVTLSLLALYFLMRRKYLVGAIVVALVNFLSFKVGWLPTGVLLVMLAIDGPRRATAVLAAVLPLLPPVAQVLAFPGVETPPSDTAEVFDAILAQHRSEDDPFTLRWVEMATIAIGAAISLRFARQTDRGLALLVGTVLVLSAACFVVFGLYFTHVSSVLPVPEIVWLSPRRALESLQILIVVCMAGMALRTEGLAAVERVTWLVWLSVFMASPNSLPGKLVASGPTLLLAILVGLRLLAPVLYRRLDHWSPPVAALLVGALLIINTIGLRFLDPPKVHRVLGAVPANIPVAMAEALRVRPDEGRYLILTRRQGALAPDRKMNFIVRKSALLYDPYYLATSEDLAEERRRSVLVETLLDNIRAGSTPQRSTACALLAYGTIVVIDEREAAALAGWALTPLSPGWVEVRPACAS